MTGPSESDTCEYGLSTDPEVYCVRPAAYLIRYDFGDDLMDNRTEWLACAECTAEIRANDGLGFVASVRSVPRERVS